MGGPLNHLGFEHTKIYNNYFMETLEQVTAINLLELPFQSHQVILLFNFWTQ